MGGQEFTNLYPQISYTVRKTNTGFRFEQGRSVRVHCVVSLLVNHSGVQLFELLAASCHKQEMNIGFYSHGSHAVEFHCQFVEKVLWVVG